MFSALRQGLAAVARSWGLVALLLAVNVGVALLFALPLAASLESDLSHRETAVNMMYGSDYAWWSRWSDAKTNPAAGLGTDVLGTGFAFRNLDLLLRGFVPAGLFATSPAAGEEAAEPGPPGAGPRIDPLFLGLGALYLLLQTFLLGGILGVFRGRQGAWTLRGLLHGSGFYFGRLLRVALLVLLADWLVFRLNGPFARWADQRALEAVSERSALAWAFGRHLLLLLVLLFVNMVSCYAKVIMVLEERSSAVLALVSSLSFCLGNLLRTFGHYLAIVVLAVLWLGAWSVVDGAWTPTGYKTQLLTLLLAQALIFGHIGLRLGLLAGQMELYRSETTAGR
jgi:hypothetical protein